MLSILILFVLLAAAGLGAWRGWRRNTPESLIRLAVLFFCALLSALLSPWVARCLPVSLYEAVMELMLVRGENVSYESLDEILHGFARGLAAPLIFLILFLLFLGVSSLILSILFASSHREARKPNGEDKTDMIREKIAGSVIGGLMGLFICVICFSPLTGTLRTADHTIEVIRSLDGVQIAVPDTSTRETIHSYAENRAMKIMYGGGGQLLYETSAKGYIRGEYFSVGEELSACTELLNDLSNLTDRMMTGERLSEESIQELREILKRTDKSPVCRLILLGQVNEQADRWLDRLNEEENMAVVMPVLEVLLEELPGRMSYETVCTDLITVVDVMEACYDMDFEGMNYEGMLTYLGEEGGMDNINRIIQQNPRLSVAVSSLSEVVTRCFYRAVDAQQENLPENYWALISDLTNTLNSSATYSDARREDTISNCLQDYAQIMGFQANSQILQCVTYSIMDAYRDRSAVTEWDIVSMFSGNAE